MADFVPLDPTEARALVTACRQALAMTQAGLGESLGVSGRTVLRWENRQGTPSRAQLEELAHVVADVDRSLAARIASLLGVPLETLGLASPVDAPPDSIDTPAIPPEAMSRFLADAVVCAAAEVAAVPPGVMRPALRAALTRMTELSFPPAALLEALSPPPPPPAPGSAREQ